MSRDSISFASRSDAVFLQVEPSIVLASVTGLTVDKHFVHKKFPSDLVAPPKFLSRTAPDTPLLPTRSDVLLGFRDMFTLHPSWCPWLLALA